MGILQGRPKDVIVFDGIRWVHELEGGGIAAAREVASAAAGHATRNLLRPGALGAASRLRRCGRGGRGRGQSPRTAHHGLGHGHGRGGGLRRTAAGHGGSTGGGAGMMPFRGHDRGGGSQGDEGEGPGDLGGFHVCVSTERFGLFRRRHSPPLQPAYTAHRETPQTFFGPVEGSEWQANRKARPPGRYGRDGGTTGDVGASGTRIRASTSGKTSVFTAARASAFHSASSRAWLAISNW